MTKKDDGPVSSEEREEMHSNLRRLEARALALGDIDEVERLSQVDVDRAVRLKRSGEGS